MVKMDDLRDINTIHIDIHIYILMGYTLIILNIMGEVYLLEYCWLAAYLWLPLTVSRWEPLTLVFLMFPTLRNIYIYIIHTIGFCVSLHSLLDFLGQRLNKLFFSPYASEGPWMVQLLLLFLLDVWLKIGYSNLIHSTGYHCFFVFFRCFDQVLF